MEICIFYSWQSNYRNNCNIIIEKALKKAVKALNNDNSEIHYVIERGGGGVLGAEHIDENIVKVIKNRADLAFVDFTHVGNLPQKDSVTGEWKKEKCCPNTNAVHENGILETVLNERQVFKIYNTAYGDLNLNLEMPFDIHQEHFPLGFYCDDKTSKEERKIVIDNLSRGIKSLIRKGTEEFLNNQKVRYAPLVPLRNEYAKAFFQSPYIPVGISAKVKDKIISGESFRLLGLPGLGKTRMVVEAFRGRDVDVYYCDCREQKNRDVIDAVEQLLTQRGGSKQVVILDNCNQRLCSAVSSLVSENGFNCQLVSIFYDPRECPDSEIDFLTVRVGDVAEVVNAMVDNEAGMPEDVKEAIIGLAGGFPLMAKMMIDNYHKNIAIVNVSKKDVFERMLGIDLTREGDSDKKEVLTAFAIFKFIGLYGLQKKQGLFIAGNKIITNIRGTADECLQLFRRVHAQYEKMEILER